MSITEKYPENCPWDVKTNFKTAKPTSWTLTNDENVFKFTTSQIDNEFIYIQKNNEENKAFNEYQARFTYQRLFDNGYELGPSQNI